MSSSTKNDKLREALSRTVVIVIVIVFIIIMYWVARYLRKWIKPKKTESAKFILFQIILSHHYLWLSVSISSVIPSSESFQSVATIETILESFTPSHQVSPNPAAVVDWNAPPPSYSEAMSDPRYARYANRWKNHLSDNKEKERY